MSRLLFTTGAEWGTAVGVPARCVACVLGTHHGAVSKGVGARRSTKDSRKGIIVVSKGWKPGW